MDFCQQEQVLPSSSVSIDNLVSAPDTGSDGSIEWLSVLVEDCLSSTSHCLPLVSSATKPLAKTLIGEIEKFPQQKNPNFCPQDSVEAPSKARGKRKRAQITKNPLAFWCHQLNPDGIFVVSTDPPLLQQEHWLADSELIVTKAGEQDRNALEQAEETEGEEWKKRALIDHKEGGGGEFVAPTDKKAFRNIKDMGCTEHEAEGQYRKKNEMVEVEVEVEMEGGGGGGDEVTGPRKGKDQKAHRNIGEEEEWHGGDKEEPDGQNWKKAKGGGVHHSPSRGHNQGGTRRCSHCLAHKTPQWRAGPMGPKTLCNACGVRYKSGRLLPEYRPAKSPTFVSYLHSNSHKKVMEMRTSLFS